jgi:hypothetical protein
MHRKQASHMKTTGILLILLWATSLSAPSQAIVEDGSAFAIHALEHQWVEGQASNDNRELDLIFDNALVYVEYGRLVTKGEYLSRVKTPEPKPPEVAMEAMTVHTFGGTAIVVGTYQEKVVTGSTVHLHRWRFLDTWVYKNGRWMLVAAGSSPSSK